MSTERRGGDLVPTRRALIVAASVTAFALIVYVVVGVVAPRFATKPPTHLSARDLTQGLTVSGLGSLGPSPTSVRSLSPTASYLSAPPSVAAAVATPIARTDTKVPA